jgi:hypothetical protein
VDFSKLQRGEIIAVLGSVILLIGLFTKWYESVSDLAVIADHKGKGSYSGWQVHSLMRYAILLAAIAPPILAWIIIRDHALSWPRGQLTSIAAIIVIGLLVYNGVIDRPGDPSSQIELRYGWFIAFAGSLLMLAGSVRRQQETELRRKPPGTI